MSTRLDGVGAAELAVDVDEKESTRTRRRCDDADELTSPCGNGGVGGVGGVGGGA